jgi:hypothetical protein
MIAGNYCALSGMRVEKKPVIKFDCVQFAYEGYKIYIEFKEKESSNTNKEPFC